jgi:hypothetical protein
LILKVHVPWVQEPILAIAAGVEKGAQLLLLVVVLREHMAPWRMGAAASQLSESEYLLV